MAAAIDRRSKTYHRWKRKAKYATRDGGKPWCIGRDHAIACEHCGKYVGVTLMQPAIMSHSQFGDWVCADCHPLSAMALLTELVV